MKKFVRAAFWVALIILYRPGVQAQDITWADTVLHVSSQKTKTLFSAAQILGKPSKYPDLSFSTCGWMPDTSSIRKSEFITVGFHKPVRPAQIIIIENYNTGHIRKISAYDSTGHDFTVYSRTGTAGNNAEGRLFPVNAEKINFRVYSLRIETDPETVNTPYQLDAVGITGIKKTPTIGIHEPDSTLFISNPEILSTDVNSQYDEVYPIISPDGKTLFFDRKLYPENMGKEKNDDIWYSRTHGDGKWEKAINIGAPLNNESHNFLCSISPDGNTALLGNTYDNSNLAGVSVATKNADGWNMPATQIIKGFENKTGYSEFNLGADGRTLLMSIEKEDSYGLRDIYVSFSTGKNTWSVPLNLGKNINTAGYEMSPFLAADGITIYFSSNGYAGYGSQDIYMSKRLDDTWQHWTEPVNMGSKINTPDWEGYYSIDAQGDYAYFSSSATSKSNLDIFRIKLPKEVRPEKVVWLKGKVYDKTTNALLDASVEFLNANDSSVNGVSNSYFDRGYALLISEKGNYSISVSAENYFPVTTHFPVDKIESYKEYIQDFYLIPQKEGVIVEMKNILFKVNSAVLEDSSFAELNKIVDFLLANPGIHIEVRGHTNGLCDDSYCNLLSGKRAKSVADYFISKGVAADRLTYKGYGKTIPVADNSTAEGRKKNQRVEFMITKAN